MDADPVGLWGVAEEISPGKDTPSGHWELAGLPVPWDWSYFPKSNPAFPEDIVAEVMRLAGTDGILGNEHASGTEIIARLGETHQATGWPICYTSVDSVFQIAAHEETFGLERLLKLCEDLAPMLHARRVGRVIARPFTGTPGHYPRTQNLATCVAEAAEGSLTFANFVEFDSLYGHRRDVSGYARHLEWFDGAIAPILAALRPDDLMLFTADHGNDPTWTGTDHTRERVPVVAKGPYSGQIGIRAFADVGVSVAAHLGVPSDGPGQSFLMRDDVRL